MSPVDQALQTLLGWFDILYAMFLKVFDVIEGYLRTALVHSGVSDKLQGLVIFIAAVLFIIVVLKVFGGVLRILLILFLILVILHVLLPLLRF